MTFDTRTPHVETAWAEEFVLALRLRGVSGSTIGAVLAEIESHCAESGETAREAFGDPEDYAAALDLPPSPEQEGPALREVTSAGVAILGIALTVASVAAWQTGTHLRPTVGQALSATVILIAFGWLALWPTAALRLIIRRPVVASLGCGALVTTAVLLAASSDAVIVRIPWPPSLVVGVVLVIGETLWSRLRDVPDPIVGPGPDGAGTLASTGVARVAAALGPWTSILLTIALCVPWFLV